MALIIYLIGCISAYLLMCKKYKDTSNNEIYNNSEVYMVVIIGTLMSWITILIYTYNKFIAKE